MISSINPGYKTYATLEKSLEQLDACREKLIAAYALMTELEKKYKEMEEQPYIESATLRKKRPATKTQGPYYILDYNTKDHAGKRKRETLGRDPVKLAAAKQQMEHAMYLIDLANDLRIARDKVRAMQDRIGMLTTRW